MRVFKSNVRLPVFDPGFPFRYKFYLLNMSSLLSYYDDRYFKIKHVSVATRTFNILASLPGRRCSLIFSSRFLTYESFTSLLSFLIVIASTLLRLAKAVDWSKVLLKVL
jgi:hypothetical protein